MAVLLPFGVDWRAALFTGFLVSLSSTAIVLKLLADRGETNTTFGQVSLGLLIFQDLAIIVMVLLVPMLAGTRRIAVWTWSRRSGKALAIILVVLLVARRLMPPLLERVARTCSPELFLLTVVAICFGTAWLTSVAGVSLSLGAFLAGLLVSESRFSQHAFGEIMPLQILFSAIVLRLGRHAARPRLPRPHICRWCWPRCCWSSVVKVVTTMVSVRALGYATPVAAAAALTLAQVGEFSFVLERAGHDVGLSPAGLGETGSQAFIAATVLLMVATPQLAALGARLGQRLERAAWSTRCRRTRRRRRPRPSRTCRNHVIVAGYGDAARRSCACCTARTCRSSSPRSVRAAPTKPKRQDCRCCAAIPPASTRSLARGHRPRQDGRDCRRRSGHGASHRRGGPLAGAIGPHRRADAVSDRGGRAAKARAATWSSPTSSKASCSCSPTSCGPTRRDPAEIERYAATIRHGGYAALVAADTAETHAMSPRSRKDIDTATPMALTPTNGTCAHVAQLKPVRPERPRVRGLPSDRRGLGPPPPLHVVRARRLLRQLAEQTCHPAFPPDRAPHRPVARARRRLGLVLSGRGDAVSSPLANDLRRVEVLVGLADEDLEWLAGAGQVLEYEPGQMVFQAGDPSDAMFVILEGAMDLMFGVGGQLVPTFVQYAGEVTGLLPFSRMVKYSGVGRAASGGPLRMLRIHKDRFRRDAGAHPGARPAAGRDDDRPGARFHARRSSSARS